MYIISLSVTLINNMNSFSSTLCVKNTYCHQFPHNQSNYNCAQSSDYPAWYCYFVSAAHQNNQYGILYCYPGIVNDNPVVSVLPAIGCYHALV